MPRLEPLEEDDDEPEGPEVFNLPGEVRVSDGPPGGPPSIIVSPRRASRSSFRPAPGFVDRDSVDEDVITRAIDTSRTYDPDLDFSQSWVPPPPKTPQRGGAAPRVFDRHSLVCEAVVTTPTGQRLTLQTANVSRRGLFVVAVDVARTSLDVGMTCRIVLVTARQTVSFDAEVIRMSDGRTPGEARQGIAFQIVYLTHQQETQLDRLIRDDGGIAPPSRRAVSRIAPRTVAFVASGIVGLLSVGFFGAWWVTETRRKVSAPVVTIVRRDLDEVVESLSDGDILPAQQLTIRSTLATARVMRILVKRGDRVAAGQVIAEDAELNATRDALAAAQRRRTSAEGRLRAAQHTRDERRLADASVIVPDLTAGIRQEVLDARQEADAHGADIKRGQVVAPFAGEIVEVVSQTGDFVSPSGAICELVDDSSMHAHVAFGEADATRVRTEMSARVFVPGAAVPLHGAVDHVGTVVHANARGRWVSVEIGLPDGLQLRPGTTASAQIVVGQRTGLLVVPARAVAGTGLRRHVLLVGQGDRAEMREVSVGTTISDLIEVTSGLQEGDRVVVDPTDAGVAVGARIAPQ